MLNFFTFYFDIALIANKRPELLWTVKNTSLNFPNPRLFKKWNSVIFVSHYYGFLAYVKGELILCRFAKCISYYFNNEPGIRLADVAISIGLFFYFIIDIFILSISGKLCEDSYIVLLSPLLSSNKFFRASFF